MLSFKLKSLLINTVKPSCTAAEEEMNHAIYKLILKIKICISKATISQFQQVEATFHQSKTSIIAFYFKLNLGVFFHKFNMRIFM